ncbi:MAG: beta-lactamase family protein [Gemmatimonadetes bacterium]|nr:beta-lactamase family protein [Gemmatimonadota bacterium]
MSRPVTIRFRPMAIAAPRPAPRAHSLARRSVPLVMALGGVIACGGKEAPPPAASAPAPTIAAIDSLVAESMRDGKVPGMSVTIVRNDSVIHSKGYGLANLEQQRPMTDSTPVVIGSTSKTITAFAIMQLVDSGKVALDSTVPHYLALLGAPTAAGTQVAKATPVDPRFNAITVRHLLTNVSGIPAGFAGEPFDVLDTATTALEALARDDMLTRPLDFAPGKGYTYSNRGFSLASLVVQDASGLSYEDYINSRIFAPLGMRHSTGRFWEGPSRGMVQGYRESVDGKPVVSAPALGRGHTGSGMILSTSRDIGQFLRAILNGGRAADGTQLLSAASTAELLRAQQPAESELGGPTTYALGWEVHDLNGVPMIMKGGSVISMGSLFVMLPQQKIGIAMLINDVDYGKLQLLQNVVKHLLGAPTTPYGAAPAAAPVAATGYRATPERLRDVAGEYMTRAGLMRVTLRGDTVAARYEGRDVILEPASDSSFIMRSVIRDQEGHLVTIKRCGTTMCAWMEGDSSAVKR